MSYYPREYRFPVTLPKTRVGGTTNGGRLRTHSREIRTPDHSPAVSGRRNVNRLTVEDADKITREAMMVSGMTPVVFTRARVIRRRRELAHRDQRRVGRVPGHPQRDSPRP